MSNNPAVARYPILDRLETERIFTVEELPLGFRLREACDGYFYDDLTRDELKALANELLSLSGSSTAVGVGS